MAEIKHHQLIIIGSGPAGCTAAIYAARANLDVAMITGMEQGGQLMKTPKIANWPGEPEEISGMDLMEKMINQVGKFTSNIVMDNIVSVDLSKKPFNLKGEDGEYSCDALIITTGASARFLGLPSEQKYIGMGVSSCVMCDGLFYKGKEVVIVGGGNSTAEEALYLSEISTKVTIIHRRTKMRAEAFLVDQLKKRDNIFFELNHVVDEVLGDDAGVTGVRIRDVESDEKKEIKVDGVFIATGHKPNAEVFEGQLKMEENYIVTDCGCKTGTSVPGVFAAGDVVFGNQKQAIVAAGCGCVAALDAKDYLAAQESE